MWPRVPEAMNPAPVTSPTPLYVLLFPQPFMDLVPITLNLKSFVRKLLLRYNSQSCFMNYLRKTVYVYNKLFVTFI